MSRTSWAWLAASGWAFASLLDSIADGNTVQVVVCSVAVLAGLGLVFGHWSDDVRDPNYEGRHR